MADRSELEVLAARHAELEAEVRERSRELEATRQLVEEVQARARLPVLDNLRVAAPCSASWTAMSGSARVRTCGDCKHHVYNLSELTRDEAETLIRTHEGRLCVRYFQRADGTILLDDCAVGVTRRRRRRRLVATGVAASLAVGAVLGDQATRTPERMHATRTAVELVTLPPPADDSDRDREVQLTEVMGMVVEIEPPKPKPEPEHLGEHDRTRSAEQAAGLVARSAHGKMPRSR